MAEGEGKTISLPQIYNKHSTYLLSSATVSAVVVNDSNPSQQVSQYTQNETIDAYSLHLDTQPYLSIALRIEVHFISPPLAFHKLVQMQELVIHSKLL